MKKIGEVGVLFEFKILSADKSGASSGRVVEKRTNAYGASCALCRSKHQPCVREGPGPCKSCALKGAECVREREVKKRRFSEEDEDEEEFSKSLVPSGSTSRGERVVVVGGARSGSGSGSGSGFGSGAGAGAGLAGRGGVAGAGGAGALVVGSASGLGSGPPPMWENVEVLAQSSPLPDGEDPLGLDEMFGGMAGNDAANWIESMLESSELAHPHLAGGLVTVPRAPTTILEGPLPKLEGFPMQTCFFELDYMLSEMQLGIIPAGVPTYLRDLAKADGGRIHSPMAAAMLSAISMRSCLRSFAIDVLSMELTPDTRALAIKAFARTRFSTVKDSEVPQALAQLLAPERSLTLDEMRAMQEFVLINMLPRVKLYMQMILCKIAEVKSCGVYLELPVPASHAAYPGELCPAHILDANSPDGFLHFPPWVNRGVISLNLASRRLTDPRVTPPGTSLLQLTDAILNMTRQMLLPKQ